MKTITELIQELLEHTKYVDIIVTCGNDVLLLRRANYMKNFRGKWCLPGGHVDSAEDSKTAIIRELKEETNISITEPELFITYQYQNGGMSDIYYIELYEKPAVKISREHAQYKWVAFEDLVKYDEKWAGETKEILNKFIENKFDKINEHN